MSRSYYAAVNIDALPPAPTADEEQELFRAFRARRTAERRDFIVRCYLRFALRAARRDMKRRPANFRTRPGMSEDDAISAANLGLVEAVERFDPEMGYRFTTYAAFWIFKYLLQARYGAHLVGISYTDKRLFGKLSRLVNRDGISLEAAARTLGLSVSEAQRLMELPSGRTVSFRSLTGDDSKPIEEPRDGRASISPDADPLVDNNSPDCQLESSETRNRLLAGLEELPPLARRVLQELYLDDRSVSEVSRRTRLSQQTVEKIRRDALQSLRRRVES